MVSLNIEHEITDFATWIAAFNSFAEVRTKHGVRQHHIRRPVDNPNFVVIDLVFDDVSQAETFLRFLQDKIWPSPQNAPALTGTPQTRILQEI